MAAAGSRKQTSCCTTTHRASATSSSSTSIASCTRERLRLQYHVKESNTVLSLNMYHDLFNYTCPYVFEKAYGSVPFSGQFGIYV
eukprot:m.86957 g.86957  ORF g.86957 m.86957 type:complete len:85 (-) comp14485_c0_seq1:340-594(-)